MFKFASRCIMLCVIAGMLLAGCAVSNQTSGRPIQDGKVSQIVKGKTTIDEVIEIFGAPQMQSEMAGNVLYVYRYTQNKGSAFSIGYFTTSGGHDTSDELTITFDKSTGTVKAFSLQRGIQS